MCILRHSIMVIAALLTLLLSARTLPARDDIEVVAVSGQPYGVGQIRLLAGGGQNANPQCWITEQNQRILFPATIWGKGPIRALLGARKRLTVFFLFKGDQPLELKVYTPEPTSLTITPRNSPADHAALISTWLESHATAAQEEAEESKYPPVVSTYLSSRLAKRFGGSNPPSTPLPPGDELTHTLRVLSASEDTRLDLLRSLGHASKVQIETADQPVPAAVRLPPLQLPPVPQNVVVEPIALHVPADCFYVRFGTFPNYLWLSHRLDDWGGQVRNLVAERSIDFGLNHRLQEELILRESALAEILGPTVIADVAILGFDTFLSDGAAMGVLFEARSSTLLGQDFREQRAEALKQNTDAKEQQIKIGAISASFISTPDNRIRSFYLVDGNYHFVTCSRKLAERFADVSQGAQSLGQTAEFRHARSLFPTSRNDTAFAYLSTTFFAHLLSPAYQVELQRRLRSLAEIDALGVARLAARAEGIDDTSLEGLIRSDWLPQNFGQRADGSKLIDRPDVATDSKRGPRGAMIPIADLPPDNVSPSEAAECTRIASQYAASWEQLSPLIAAVGRSSINREGLEKVTIDVRATPLAKRHYKFLAQQIGLPQKEQLAPVPGDVVAFDVILSEPSSQQTGDYHLFGGLRNGDPRLASGGVLERVLGMFGGQEIEGYLGGIPRPGWLFLLGATTNLPVDENGFSRYLTGAWRRTWGQFTVLSFHPQVLAQITTQLKFISAPRPAQGWIRAEDLRTSKLAPLLNAYGYRNALNLSYGNARLLNALSDQLRVPPAEANRTALNLLGAKLTCTLGGEYQLKGPPDESRWMSTAWPDTPTPVHASAPPKYETPALYWLRGVNLELRLTEQELAVHAEIDMPVKTRSGFQLPSLSLPGKAKPKPPEEIPAQPARSPREL